MGRTTSCGTCCWSTGGCGWVRSIVDWAVWLDPTSVVDRGMSGPVSFGPMTEEEADTKGGLDIPLGTSGLEVGVSSSWRYVGGREETSGQIQT